MRQCLQILSDLDFCLSRSPKVNCKGAIGLAMYDFALMVTFSLTRLLYEI